MLSNDELTDGMPFILQLPDVAGKPVWWLQTLKGDVARRWYEIYRRSDWATLRLEAAGMFLNRVSQSEAERARTSERCVVIKTDQVNESQLQPAGATADQGVT
jgi:hypothetical protein